MRQAWEGRPFERPNEMRRGATLASPKSATHLYGRDARVACPLPAQAKALRNLGVSVTREDLQWSRVT
jgi:hypothetical protein